MVDPAPCAYPSSCENLARAFNGLQELFIELLPSFFLSRSAQRGLGEGQGQQDSVGEPGKEVALLSEQLLRKGQALDLDKDSDSKRFVPRYGGV